MAAMVANAGIAVAKFVGFAVTGASSMLAEGVHSVADSGNQALLLWGGVAAARAPTPSHPFGHGRERYFWSFVVALVIFSLGSVFALYEGVHKILDPHPLNQPIWAVGILGLGVVLEGGSFLLALKEARKRKGRASWSEFIRHSKEPELPVVLLEDLGALLGLVLAMVGVSLAWATGDGRFDGAGSVVIGLLLGLIAAVLALEMKSLLIGESAGEDDRERICQAIDGQASVVRLINLRTQHLGPASLLVAAKVEFARELDVVGLTHAIDEVEAGIRDAVPIARYIYLEPDVFDSAHPPRGGPDAEAHS